MSSNRQHARQHAGKCRKLARRARATVVLRGPLIVAPQESLHLAPFVALVVGEGADPLPGPPGRPLGRCGGNRLVSIRCVVHHAPPFFFFYHHHADQVT